MAAYSNHPGRVGPGRLRRLLGAKQSAEFLPQRTVVRRLHGRDPEQHPDHGTPGNGLLLFFRVDDFDVVLQRARSLVTRLEEEPHVNPGVLAPRSGRTY